jgi:hypothetical protein
MMKLLGTTTDAEQWIAYADELRLACRGLEHNSDVICAIVVASNCALKIAERIRVGHAGRAEP